MSHVFAAAETALADALKDGNESRARALILLKVQKATATRRLRRPA